MSVSSWGRCPVPSLALRAFLAACLLAPAVARGQTVEQSDSDTTEPPQRLAAGARTPDLGRVSTLIFEGTNRFRRLHGIGELKLNPELGKSAREFADYLAKTDKFSHTADGRQPAQRVAAAGYDYCIVAENIAWEFNSAGFGTRELAQTLLTGWKNSPGHRRNLLDPDVTEVGIAAARSEKTGRYYAVQDFGRPKSAAIVFRVTNETDAVARYLVDGKSFTLPPGVTRTHERCRPAELDFQGAADSPAPEGSGEFHPANGQTFSVRGDGAGGYRMVEKSP
jgi:uncharacterized protein YkwD